MVVGKTHELDNQAIQRISGWVLQFELGTTTQKFEYKMYDRRDYQLKWQVEVGSCKIPSDPNCDVGF